MASKVNQTLKNIKKEGQPGRAYRDIYAARNLIKYKFTTTPAL